MTTNTTGVSAFQVFQGFVRVGYGSIPGVSEIYTGIDRLSQSPVVIEGIQGTVCRRPVDPGVKSAIIAYSMFVVYRLAGVWHAER